MYIGIIYRNPSGVMDGSLTPSPGNECSSPACVCEFFSIKEVEYYGARCSCGAENPVHSNFWRCAVSAFARAGAMRLPEHSLSRECKCAERGVL